MSRLVDQIKQAVAALSKERGQVHLQPFELPCQTGAEEVKFRVPCFVAGAVASIIHDDLRHMTGNVMVVS